MSVTSALCKAGGLATPSRADTGCTPRTPKRPAHAADRSRTAVVRLCTGAQRLAEHSPSQPGRGGNFDQAAAADRNAESMCHPGPKGSRIAQWVPGLSHTGL